MGLRERIDELLQYVKDHEEFTSHNHKMLDIYEGNLKPYVLDVMKETLSNNYYEQIKSRVLPINILRRVYEKLSKVYMNEPMRMDQKYQEFIDEYSDSMYLNQQMNNADTYANLFKGYALEPYIVDGEPRLRVLPYDRFLVKSDDKVDPLNPTVFIKFMGSMKKLVDHGRTKELRDVQLYYAYTDEEFLAFDSDGQLYAPAMDENEGINPVGVIPFVYGNRSLNNLIPTIDTDVLSIVTGLAVGLTDLSGAILFQCFSIIYGVDISQANLTMSPNAFWDLKSDPQSDKTPQVGTIKPEADIDKVLEYWKNVFTFWLETKGVRVGSIGSMDAANAASGIAKIIDEMDSFEIRKQNIQYFRREEAQLWELLKIMNNYWVISGQLDGQIIGDDFAPMVEFDDPQPSMSRREEVELTVFEIDRGILPLRKGITRLYPDLGEDELEEWLEEINEGSTVKEILNGESNDREESQGGFEAEGDEQESRGGDRFAEGGDGSQA